MSTFNTKLAFISCLAMVLSGCGAGMTDADRDFARKLVRGVAAGYGTPAPVKPTYQLQKSWKEDANTRICVYGDGTGAQTSTVISAGLRCSPYY